MVKIGDMAPDIELVADDGETVRLSRLVGKPVVLYFYPKDDTSGCTLEAQNFTSLAREFATAGVDVFGVSPDSVESHCKFRNKHGLKVRLLADPEKVASIAYGVWIEKSMYGRRYMGVERSTFLIDKSGRIAEAWIKVQVPGHAEEVLEAARAAGRPAGKTAAGKPSASPEGKARTATKSAKASKTPVKTKPGKTSAAPKPSAKKAATPVAKKSPKKMR